MLSLYYLLYFELNGDNLVLGNDGVNGLPDSDRGRVEGVDNIDEFLVGLDTSS